MIRDERWENIRASANLEESWVGDGSRPMVSFLFELVVGDKVLYSKTLVDPTSLRRYTNLRKEVLDGMVERMDAELEKNNIPMSFREETR